jgi:hypothetical protein
MSIFQPALHDWHAHFSEASSTVDTQEYLFLQSKLPRLPIVICMYVNVYVYLNICVRM